MINSEKEAADKLKVLLKSRKDKRGKTDTDEALEIAIKSLEYKWISVSEGLPEKYGDYLVTFNPSAGTLGTKVIIAHYSDLMGIAKLSFWIGEVGKSDFADITDQVTAWYNKCIDSFF